MSQNDDSAPSAPQTADGIPTFTTSLTTTTSSSLTTSPTVSSATASTPAIASQPISHGNNCKGTVGPGTVAGAAVGAAIGGALIAFLVTWLFVRSKNGHKDSRPSHRHRSAEKDLIQVNTTEVHDQAVTKSHRWESHLPQPTDDSSLRLSVKTLFHQIELHVENFYSDVNGGGAPLPEELQGGIQQYDSNDLPANASTMLQQSTASTAIIKHCLMKHIVSNISVEEMGQTSFLPAECTALPLATRNGLTMKKPGANEAFSQWRVLTSYLRPATATESRNEAAYVTTRDLVIQDSAQRFSAAFTPWATSRQSDNARVQNLTEIMRNAVEVGIVIFSQASNFRYTWTVPSEGRSQSRARNNRSMVVTPGFVKVTDENARPLSRGQVIVPPLVADI